MATRPSDPTAACGTEPVQEACALLRRAIEAFVPNHDEANALSLRLGLGQLANSDLVDEIWSFIGRHSNV